jgi:hypothetical protein
MHFKAETCKIQEPLMRPQECELGFYYSDLEALKLDFDEHLRTNPNSEFHVLQPICRALIAHAFQG